MKYFSTFTGIGGFEIGIQNAYTKIAGLADTSEAEVLAGSSANDKGEHGGQYAPRCVGYSEIDKYATSVYRKQFKGAKNYGDITKINAETLPDFDCLVGGFPCQAFSIAGHRGGFDDTRGTLFFDLARILRAKRPRLFVFENVKGLLSHDSGRTIRTIIATITELGYDCQWQVLNSKDYGVPQNRERIIIVGHLRGTPRPEVFPLEGSNRNHIKEITRAVPQAQRVYDEDGIAPSVDTGQGGNRQAKIIQRPRGKNEGGEHDVAPTVTGKSYQDNNVVVRIPEATQKGYAEATVGDSINLNNPNSKTRRGRVGKGIANTLTSSSMDQYTIQPSIINPKMRGFTPQDHSVAITASVHKEPPVVLPAIRRLTPIECERLQAFPDDWTKYGIEGPDASGNYDIVEISDTQRYKMCGNAVTTTVIQAVFERIFAGEEL